MAKGKKTGGRVAGTPNRANEAARVAVAHFIDKNVDKLSKWLDEIYEEDGAKVAFASLSDMLEYHIPKLARTEVTGKDGGAVQVSWPLAPTKLDD